VSRDASEHQSLPAAFGPYRVEREIGTGVLGPVLQARESRLDRVVAVKAFTSVAGGPGVAAFGRALASITESGLAHPSIVQPLAAGVEDGVPFLVSELVVGDSLDAALARYGPAPAADTARLVAQIAAALDAARSVGLAHGRLSPRDLLVTPELVRVTGSGVAAALESCGLPSPVASAYAAPERIAGREWDHRADVYSMAAIAWELLTGRRLSSGGAPLTAAAGDIEVARPEELREALARALHEDPALRFESVRDFASALEVALTGRGSRVTPPARAVGTAADEPGSERHARRRPARAPRDRSGSPAVSSSRGEPAPGPAEAAGGAALADQLEEAAVRAERAAAAVPVQAPSGEPLAATSGLAGPAPTPSAVPQTTAESPAASESGRLAPTPASVDTGVRRAGHVADPPRSAGPLDVRDATPAPPEDGGSVPTAPRATDARPEAAPAPAIAEPLDLPLVVDQEEVPAELPFE
jgi:serine/threonine-protein kinase